MSTDKIQAINEDNNTEEPAAVVVVVVALVVTLVVVLVVVVVDVVAVVGAFVGSVVVTRVGFDLPVTVTTLRLGLLTATAAISVCKSATKVSARILLTMVVMVA